MSLDLRKLNPAQREAVTTIEGPVLVLAGAGTGKTRVITYRIAHLLERDVPPSSILAVTFTNKAAREMQGRLRKLARERSKGVVLSTFHSLGMRVLRAEATKIGYRSGFGISDTADQLSLVRTILRDLRGDIGSADRSEVLAAISRAKNAFQLPEDVLEAAADDREHLVALVYRRYRDHLRDLNCVDFDDLILLPVRLLEKEDEVRERYQRQFRYILVDEYQDTNGSQYRMLRALVSPRRNLCVVGDDDQSIYGFRGADREKILGFERDFPGARVIKLEENYRSTGSILNLANAVISGNERRHAKILRSNLGTGAPVRWVSLADEAAEVEFVVREIDVLRRDPLTRKDSIAILVRSAQQARPFEEQLRLHKIPYTLIGGQSHFDRKEIRDALAYWKTAANPADDLSLARIINTPRRGLGSESVRKMDELARERGRSLRETLPLVASGGGDFTPRVRSAAAGLDELFTRAAARLERRAYADATRLLLEEASYADALAELYPDPLVRQSRWNVVEALLRSAEAWARESPGAEFGEFLSALALDEKDDRSSEDPDPERGGVTLMTLHSAKGLEFERVFLVGAEEDLLPHKKSAADGDHAIEEERRLFYVGVTRARRHLVLTWALARNLYGKAQLRAPSRFLAGLEDQSLLESEAAEGGGEASEDDVREYMDLYRRLTSE